uniref:Uncharacterized protein n=1 Tax=Gadus morhua TaxID=8049 RepID=A0A8C5AL83_GADMO
WQSHKPNRTKPALLENDAPRQTAQIIESSLYLFDTSAQPSPFIGFNTPFGGSSVNRTETSCHINVPSPPAPLRYQPRAGPPENKRNIDAAHK